MIVRLLVVPAVIFVSLILAPVLSPAQIVDFCESTATSNGGCLLVCPEGDGDHLSGIDATIHVTVIYMDNPIPNIPAADFWLIACDPADELVLCGGFASCSADGPTDAQGKTTISGPITAGGCAEGLAVVVQGIVLNDPVSCNSVICLPIKTRSPDLDNNLAVELPDLTLFAQAFYPLPYQTCADFNCDGVVGLVDLALFAVHFKVPGHGCGP
jgi:hypothetical protein